MAQTKKALVAVANSSEDIEFVSIVDVLRRANVQVDVAGVGASPLTLSRGTKIIPDLSLEDDFGKISQTTYDLIVLPGGMPGATHLANSPKLVQLLKAQKSAGRWFAAICAAPAVVFEAHGLLEGHKATSYPAFQEKLDISRRSNEKVVVSKNCITSQGPGTALEFAVCLVEALFDYHTAAEIGSGLLIEYNQHM